jgi:hypothetical protein
LEFEPLYLAMAGITAVKHSLPSLLAWSRTDLADRLAAHELGRIRALAEDRGLNGQFVAHLAACITLTGGSSREGFEDVVADERTALRFDGLDATPDVAHALRDALPHHQADAVAPILPDLIGEAAILTALRGRTAAQQASIVHRAYCRAPAAAVESVVRIAQDYARSRNHEALGWLDAIVAKVDDVRALMAICDQLPRRTTNLRERVAAIQAATVDRLRAASGGGETDKAQLARRLDELAIRLSELGQRDEALKAAEEAVSLGRELAATQPGAVRAPSCWGAHHSRLPPRRGRTPREGVGDRRGGVHAASPIGRSPGRRRRTRIRPRCH